MVHIRSVLLIAMLLAGSLSPPVTAQEYRSSPPPERVRTFELEQNYPTPVSTETYIPFPLDSTLFANQDTAVVSMRIYNMLRQLVAIPVTADVEGRGGGQSIINLAYTEPGRKIAHWDGRDAAGQPLPSGIYYCQLEVRGESAAQSRQII